MCTALSFKTTDHYFGRNLDIDRSYGEALIIAPALYPFSFKYAGECRFHPSIIGIGTVYEGYPLYYEATNSEGLSMAGLDFPKSCVYSSLREGYINLAPFELIPFLLCNCKSALEAAELSNSINLTEDGFGNELPAAPLHWLLSNRELSYTIEPCADGLKICENSVGVLTNEPPFEKQKEGLSAYKSTDNIPGDNSSPSRFIRAALIKERAFKPSNERESVMQFFHILESVQQIKGLKTTLEGREHYTLYSSCCNTDRGIYYYKNYWDREIRCHALEEKHRKDTKLSVIPFTNKESINK